MDSDYDNLLYISSIFCIYYYLVGVVFVKEVVVFYSFCTVVSLYYHGDSIILFTFMILQYNILESSMTSLKHFS